MSEKKKHLLEIELYLKYYKGKNINDRYQMFLNNIVLDADVMNNIKERLYITLLDKRCKMEQENKQLKQQLKYLRSGEYLNQVKFERDMLQNVVDNGEVSKEDKEFIDMTHRNTELLEQLEKMKQPQIFVDTDIEDRWGYELENDYLKEQVQQLKEQLQHKYNNFPKSVKDLSKEQLESLYLDLLHIENEKNKKLNQRDSIIEEAIEYLKCHAVYDTKEYKNFADCLDQEECNDLLEILKKYKGDVDSNE